jgi:hypothetical protein
VACRYGFFCPLVEDAALEAYKLAGQTTFWTAFNRRLIHGVQAILQDDRDPVL